MSSSFSSYGGITTEKGLAKFSSETKSFFDNFFNWSTDKYTDNITDIFARQEEVGAFKINNNLNDINLLLGININSHSKDSGISSFNSEDVNLTTNEITLSTIGSLVKGDWVSISPNSGQGSNPNNIGTLERLYIKDISHNTQKNTYLLKFSKEYEGETIEFTDKGSLNDSENGVFYINYVPTYYSVNLSHDKPLNEWQITNYSNSGNSFDINDLSFNGNINNKNSIYDFYNYYQYILTKEDKTISIDAWGNSIDLYNSEKSIDPIKQFAGLTELGYSISSDSNLGITEIDYSESFGIITALKDYDSKELILFSNSDNENSNIIYENSYESYIDISEILPLEEKIYFIETIEKENDLNGNYIREKYLFEIDTTSDTSKSVLLEKENFTKYEGDTNTWYDLIPENDGDIWIVKNSYFGDISDKNYRYNHDAIRINDNDFTNLNFTSSDVSIQIANSYQNYVPLEGLGTTGFILDKSGEQYIIEYAYTSNQELLNAFSKESKDIEQGIAYAISINEPKKITENSNTVFTFASYKDVIWSIKDGYDSDKFKINETIGTLSFLEAPDYENPTDSDEDNIYQLVIRSTDNDKNIIDQFFSVTVTDTPESSTAIKETVGNISTSFKRDPLGFSSVNKVSPVEITAYQDSQNYTLNHIKDYGGELHAGDTLDSTPNSYEYQGMLDINGDSIYEAIFTNKSSKRWVTTKVDSSTGQINFNDNGAGGGTRVVGIYEDPLIAEGENNGGFLSDGVTPAPANFGVSDADRYIFVDGETIDRLALNSQVRFQNDLEIDNLQAKHSGDYDSDGIHEVYWKTNDGTAFLRSLMHADGNIRYANYQSVEQMSKYLTAQGHESVITEII